MSGSRLGHPWVEFGRRCRPRPLQTLLGGAGAARGALGRRASPTAYARSRPTAGRWRKVALRVGPPEIDSVNVLQRAHYLPLFARVRPCTAPTRPTARRGTRRGGLVEYWGHEASLLPVAGAAAAAVADGVPRTPDASAAACGGSPRSTGTSSSASWRRSASAAGPSQRARTGCALGEGRPAAQVAGRGGIGRTRGARCEFLKRSRENGLLDRRRVEVAHLRSSARLALVALGCERQRVTVEIDDAESKRGEGQIPRGAKQLAAREGPRAGSAVALEQIRNADTLLPTVGRFGGRVVRKKAG